MKKIARDYHTELKSNVYLISILFLTACGKVDFSEEASTDGDLNLDSEERLNEDPSEAFFFSANIGEEKMGLAEENTDPAKSATYKKCSYTTSQSQGTKFIKIRIGSDSDQDKGLSLTLTEDINSFKALNPSTGSITISEGSKTYRSGNKSNCSFNWADPSKYDGTLYISFGCEKMYDAWDPSIVKPMAGRAHCPLVSYRNAN